MSPWDDFRKPINIVFLVISLASIAVGYILYAKSQKEASPTYTVTPSEFKVFDNHMASPKLILSDLNGKRITENVYLSEAVFWNSGNLPIEPQDVRSPIRVILAPCKSILDYRILKQTRPNIAVMQLSEDSTMIAKPDSQALRLTWHHLDPDFGARFQIIYTSSEPATISFEGYIVGTKSILAAPPPGKQTFILAFMNIMIGVVASVWIMAIGLTIQAIRAKTLRKVRIGNVALVLVVSICFLLVRFLLLAPLQPPV